MILVTFTLISRFSKYENSIRYFFIGPASARSYKIGVVGNSLVGNVVFLEMALRIFLVFCMKLGDYKNRKVAEANFWKKSLIWRYLQKGHQISPKSDTDIFLKNGFIDFFGFWPKVLNKTYNLNETYFSETFSVWRYFTSNSSKNCQCFWPFSRLHIISFPWFCT